MHLNESLYSQKFSGKFFAIKITGAILADKKSTEKLISEIEILNKHNIRVLLVFGAGTQISAEFPEMGKIHGVRVTDPKNMGKIKKIVSKMSEEFLSKFSKRNINATVTQRLCIAIPKGEKYGATGEPRYFDRFEWDKVKHHSVILVPSIVLSGCDKMPDMNVNADHIMQFIAQNIKPEKVIFLTPLVLQDDRNRKITICTRRLANKYISEKIITDGMLEKVKKIFSLLDKGINRIQLLQYEDSIIEEVFSLEGRGTMFINHWENELIWKKGTDFTREFLWKFLTDNPSTHVKKRSIPEIVPENFWVLEFDGYPAAIGHIEPVAENVKEVGSFVVNGEMAGHGLGSYFVRNIVGEITRERYTYTIAVTDNPAAAYLFKSKKFEKYIPENFPEDIQKILAKRQAVSPKKDIYIYTT